MGEHQDPGVHFVMVEEKRNILIGYVYFLDLPIHFSPILFDTDSGYS